jgi:hypothetical protein
MTFFLASQDKTGEAGKRYARGGLGAWRCGQVVGMKADWVDGNPHSGHVGQ